MSEISTNDAREGKSTRRDPLPESRQDESPVTTQAEEQERAEDTLKHSKKRRDDTPRKEEEEEEDRETKESDAPPLPDEVPPPLPNEAPPGEDDGWEPVWDANAQAYYFYNRFTGVSQWDNPRVPDPSTAQAPAAAAAPGTEGTGEKVSPPVGGYNPAIHGDYDPTAPYAQQYEQPEEGPTMGGGPVNPAEYATVGSFNRFTGRWQGESQNPEYHNDENKSRRQMYAYFDVDAAANSHDGRSLRAERSAKKLSKKELKMFKEKRREKKEEKRRAWLRD
ncbi:WW domain-containing protein [Aspergillus lucknowensis]|uniref:WW domain-containing protein n=1 Tax=Aspergillus lucknowensis TaxID=176173 RepID=A0ABR4LNY9_9EURO